MATVIIIRIAIVALFISLNNSVAAYRIIERTIITTAIRVIGITVVTLLSALCYTVTANDGAATSITRVIVRGITLFTRINDSISTNS
jgi:hypothetical protein